MRENWHSAPVVPRDYVSDDAQMRDSVECGDQAITITLRSG
jgi:hypothetical protein